MDKVPKQPMTHNKHPQTQTSIIKQAMTNATLLLTQVTPNDCGIQRGSGCFLRAPCPNYRLRRWLSRCLCLTHRGHWPDPLPSSCGIRWWCLRSTAGYGGSRSHTERPVDECSAPPSHPGDILLHLVGLELILLPVGQEVVDGVLQPTLVAMDPRCDGLPTGIGNSIAVRGPESWSLVLVEDSGSEENLGDGFQLHLPWTWDLHYPVPGGGGDAQVLQQSPELLGLSSTSLSFGCCYSSAGDS
jgi:hypothetical protein